MPKKIVLYDPCAEILGVRISTRFDWENALRWEDRSKVRKIFQYLREKELREVYFFGSFAEERLFRGADGIPGRLGKGSLELIGVYSAVPLLATGGLDNVAEVEAELAESSRKHNGSPFDQGIVRFSIREEKPEVFAKEDASRFRITCISNYQVSPIELNLIQKELLEKYLKK